MIAEMAVMKRKPNAKASTVNALNLNSVVEMENVFRQDGGVIMKMIAAIIQMK